MNILKSIGAIVAGFLVVALLSTLTDFILEKIGILPGGALFATPLLLLALFYRTIYTILGGYITAKLAPYNPMKLALILAAIGILAGTAGALTTRDLGPGWYAWGIVILALPSIWFGAKIALKKV